jgi:hypothetical protein
MSFSEDQLSEFEGILEQLARELNLSPEELEDEIQTEIESRIERELLQEPGDDETDWWKRE